MGGSNIIEKSITKAANSAIKGIIKTARKITSAAINSLIFNGINNKADPKEMTAVITLNSKGIIGNAVITAATMTMNIATILFFTKFNTMTSPPLQSA